jgi:glycosyltransferase involved in cell wall biosynthesis
MPDWSSYRVRFVSAPPNVNAQTTRVTHVITDINPGGAELALLRLVEATSQVCEHSLIVISGWDPLREQFERLGVPVTVIGLGRRSPNPVRVVQLLAAVRGSRPHVVQTWMPAGDLLGGIAARLTTRAPVVWNLRNSELDPQRSHRMTRLVTRLNGRLSRMVPARIVAVADKAARVHAELGYDPRRTVVIHNGFVGGANTEVDRPLFGFVDRDLVVSRLGRYHPDKDHASLITAWSAVAEQCPYARLALAGQDMDDTNDELCQRIRAAGVEGSVRLLGRLNDPAPLYAVSDITVSNSLAEGLPNVVGEAMAHGVPAVVTDAGDSASLVGDTGRVVPCGDPDALAAAIIDLARTAPPDRQALGDAARRRIENEFSMEAMAARYVALWNEVAGVRD